LTDNQSELERLGRIKDLELQAVVAERVANGEARNVYHALELVTGRKRDEHPRCRS